MAEEAEPESGAESGRGGAHGGDCGVVEDERVYALLELRLLPPVLRVGEKRRENRGAHSFQPVENQLVATNIIKFAL